MPEQMLEQWRKRVQALCSIAEHPVTDTEVEFLLFLFRQVHEEAVEAIAAWLETEPQEVTRCDGHRHPDGQPCAALGDMTLAGAAAAIRAGVPFQTKKRPPRLSVLEDLEK